MPSGLPPASCFGHRWGGVDRVAKVHLVRREDSRGIAGRIRQDDDPRLESVSPPRSRTRVQLAQRGDVEDGVDAGRGDRAVDRLDRQPLGTRDEVDEDDVRGRRRRRELLAVEEPNRPVPVERQPTRSLGTDMPGPALGFARSVRRGQPAGVGGPVAVLAGIRPNAPNALVPNEATSARATPATKSGPRLAECSRIHLASQSPSAAKPTRPGISSRYAQ